MKLVTDIATLTMVFVGVFYLRQLRYKIIIDKDGVARKIPSKKDKLIVNICIILYVCMVAYIGISIR